MRAMSECQWSLEVLDVSRMKSRGIHINLRRWEAGRMWVRESTFESIASTLKISTLCMCSVDGWLKMRKIHFVAEIFTLSSLFSHIHCHHMWCHFLLEHHRRASKLSRTHVFIVVEDAERHPTAVRRENEYKNNTRKIIFTEWMRTSKNKNSLIRLCTCMRSSRSSLTRCDLCDFIATPTVAYWKLRVRKPKIAGQIKWLKIDD